MVRLLHWRWWRRSIDERRVVEAIRAAEQRTSGEIRVSVSPFFLGDVRRVGARAFERLGMTRTRHRNGVLFFLVPSRRRFVVLGDAGIHEKIGDAAWTSISETVSEQFVAGDFTGGLLRGIALAGDRLAEHFPANGAQSNELADEIDRG